MVQSLPDFLNLCLNVCSPCQVLWDVYTEATHPLHRGPTDHKRGVGPLLSLSEVHNQLFSFAHVQRETVVLAPWCESLYLIQVCGLIIVGNEAQNHSTISKFDNRSGVVRGHAVVGVVVGESRAGGSGHSPVGLLCSGWWSLRWTGLLSPLQVCRWGSLESSHRVKSLGRGLWVLKLAWWGLLHWKLSYSRWIAALHSSHFCCQCVWGKSAGRERCIASRSIEP